MSFEHLSVLIIDDSNDDARLAQRRMQQEDGSVDIVIANSLSQGIETVDTSVIDVVLLDLSLGKTNGIETLKEFRAAAPDIPVVIWSGTADEKMASQTIEEGAQDFTSKDALRGRWLLLVLRNAVQRQRLRLELEQANAELEQFAYAASHDLQEPIRAISYYGQLLQRDAVDKLDERQTGQLQRIVEGGDRMRQMVMDLLEYMGVGSRDLTSVRLSDCIDAACRNLALTIESCEASVTIGLLPSVVGNPHQLTQLFQNLISNALKYRGPDPPTVDIEAEVEGHSVIVSVVDNGIGIERAYRDKVFGLFKRLQHRDEYSGTGIGLAICRKIVAGHKGEIWIEDSESGVGSVFRVKLAIAEIA